MIASRNLNPASKLNPSKNMLGCIPKSELQDGVTYIGTCSRADQAVWHADKQRFVYTREVHGLKFAEEACHPEDDKYYECFEPLLTVKPGNLFVHLSTPQWS